MAKPEVVYSWPGPPALELQRQEVALSSGLRYVGHRLVAGGGRPGAIVIAQREDEILWLRSERPSAGAAFLELPRGFSDTRDTDPTCTDTAEREFLEETGFHLAQPRQLGEYVTDTAIYPMRVGVVHGYVRHTAASATDGEAAAIRWIPIHRCDALIADGTLRDAHSLSALAIWRATFSGPSRSASPRPRTRS